MKTRNAMFGIVSLLATAAITVAACGKRTDASATDTEAPVVIGPENIAVVAETLLVDGPSISGSLAAEREARVNAELGGSVLQVYVEAGQSVKAGQPLAQIEPQTAREQA